LAADIRVSVYFATMISYRESDTKQAEGISVVMPGFMPGIHVLRIKQDVDGRDKPGHDGE
jgi:hypothetical protein